MQYACGRMNYDRPLSSQPELSKPAFHLYDRRVMN